MMSRLQYLIRRWWLSLNVISSRVCGSHSTRVRKSAMLATRFWTPSSYWILGNAERCYVPVAHCHSTSSCSSSWSHTGYIRTLHVSQILSARVLTHWNHSVLGFGPEPNRCNSFYHTKTWTVAIRPVLPPKTRHFNLTTLAPIRYLSSDHKVKWSVHRLCSFTNSFAARFQIWDPTNICGVTFENLWISPGIGHYFTATQQISVGSQIWMLDVKQRINLHHVRINHVTVRSELTFLIGDKAVGTVNLEWCWGCSPDHYQRFCVRPV